MKAFLSSISRNKRFVVAELFLVYFAHGLGSIMLGSVLPDLRAAYGLDYQLGGTLISSQSVGYLGIGLLSGILAVKWGLKRAYLILYYLFAVGFVMLLTGGSPLWLLAAMFLTGISKGGITDYNNRVMSEYANGSATPLNMLHAAFAFGACVAPLAVLACQKLGGENGWRLALEIAVVLLTFGLVFGLFMKMDEEKPAESTQKSATDYGFFRERLFWLTTALCFFYEAVEASMMGWLTTFYIDSGVLAAGAAQIVTSLLWISLLVGRFSCSVIAARFRPWQMITVMCFGIAAFLVLLVLGTSLPVLIVATIGLGLCMSGMYGTTVLECRRPVLALSGLDGHLCYAERSGRSGCPGSDRRCRKPRRYPHRLCSAAHRGGDARRFRSVQHALPEKTLKSLSSRSRCRADLHRDFRFSPFINFIAG